MYEVKTSTKFDKDFNRVEKRGYDMTLLQDVITILQNCNALEKRHKDHPLIGNYIGYRECHIKPDWLLVYKIDTEHDTLELTRTGTHSDLFD
ncbi:MAG: type II toxin-antitoxin system YafQ family toxin [Planctomycetaceae bacterium]|jgi:mRNA interferase YafQ|nr:type II toxin-antitoxin system YafQ family toxin [Planctomycetaceae bacterium]